MDLEEVDPMFNPKKVSFVDELEKAQPVARCTRSQGQVSFVRINLTTVGRSRITMTDVFKALMVADPTVICFILNASMVMKPSKPLLNNFKEIDIVPELGTEETQGMTDAFCDIKKNDFDQLKYVQAMDKVNGESDWDDELWDVKRVIRHRGRPGKA